MRLDQFKIFEIQMSSVITSFNDGLLFIDLKYFFSFDNEIYNLYHSGTISKYDTGILLTYKLLKNTFTHNNST